MNRGTLKPELSALTRRNGPFGTNAGRAMLSVGHRSRYRRRWRGWHDEAIVLPRERSSADPDGLHQQPVLVPSLWGGSGPRHPRDAQSPHRITPRCLAVPIGPSVCSSSGAVTPDAAQQSRDGAPPRSSAARWRVNSRDWAGRLGLPRLVTRPYANHWRRQARVPSIADLRWRPHPRGGPGRGRFGSAE